MPMFRATDGPCAVLPVLSTRIRPSSDAICRNNAADESVLASSTAITSTVRWLCPSIDATHSCR